MKISYIIFFLIFLVPVASLMANPTWAGDRVVEDNIDTQKATFQIIQVIEGLEHPWAIAFLPNEDILVTERPGRLWRFDRQRAHRIGGLPSIQAIGQGGLMDVIVHPQFERNRQIFISYASEFDGGVGTRVASARLENDQLRDFRVIFSMRPPGRGRVHFGSRLAFDSNGLLYLTIGDRGERNQAQQLDNHAGKLMRIRADGTAPSSNPFFDTPEALPEIYSYGHRNQQGLVIDPRDGTIWTHEHGPRGGDTLHFIEPGKNYGWPIATYGEEYRGGTIGQQPSEVKGVVYPVHHWVPTSIAPSGLALYLGSSFPGWNGDLLVGALVQTDVIRLKMEGRKVVEEERLLNGRLGRIRDVRIGPDGNVWLATDARAGGIFKLKPVSDQ